MPGWLTVLMLLPMTIWMLVYGVLIFTSDGMVSGLGTGKTLAFALPLAGLWVVLDGLIGNRTEQVLSGSLILFAVALFFLIRYQRRNKELPEDPE